MLDASEMDNEPFIILAETFGWFGRCEPVMLINTHGKVGDFFSKNKMRISN